MTFRPQGAVAVFETSGTTHDRTGRHYFERTSLALYDAALLAGFQRYVLDGDPALRLRYLLLVPQRETSSLGHMMRCVATRFGDGNEGRAQGGSYLSSGGDRLDVEGFVQDAQNAYAAGVPVCIAGTAFAFVALLDALEGRAVRTAEGSRVMETGGFKGRTRIVERSELYADLMRCFGLPLERVIAEYGMTELSSQYYDAPEDRLQSTRRKIGPPWLRPLIVGADGREVSPGEAGIVRHVDLANRGSVLAIETEDLAVRCSDGAFILLGRDERARLRGCSLDAEELLARRS